MRARVRSPVALEGTTEERVGIFIPEISYEVEFYYASQTLIDGPKKGRAGAAKGVCMEVYFLQYYSIRLQYRDKYICENRLQFAICMSSGLPFFCQNLLKCSYRGCFTSILKA